MVRTAKNLVKQTGILSSPNRKAGKPLCAKTVKEVHDFYFCDEVSRVMPGKKDFLSIYVNGIKTHAQKHLILGNLNDVYIRFRELYPETKVGFSKFAEIRPKNCVLAGASGTHAVRVCTIHQNVKLMLTAIQQSNFTIEEENYYLKTYQHCLPLMMCNPAQSACYFGKCSECPGSENLAQKISDFFNNTGVENITFKQWLSTNRLTLETLVKSSEDFTAFLIEKLQLLLQHSFIATERATFLKELKVNLKINEVIALGDLAENYSFILQDAAQGFHWNNAQATIHPFVAYFLDDKNNLAHENLAIISDCLIHNTVAVHLFQKYLISHLTEICKVTIKKLLFL
ncbi:hypothetical protein AVEN_262218-1 [Araneus ventricosus]|uniref:Uncharacterized protein n=1 Tax=Araneus ventricosus TaxID=182803 RepID=A0A4Y2UQZ5_ARAVE|nr:hypothetical protein AVEN_170590-1 [Araneus ventricosus]GBO15469.1 hypothetical protein AVEN_262218-1 [Araneus ventricosus]